MPILQKAVATFRTNILFNSHFLRYDKVVSGEDSNPFAGQNDGQILRRLWYIKPLFTPLKRCGVGYVLVGCKWSKPLLLPFYLRGKSDRRQEGCGKARSGICGEEMSLFPAANLTTFSLQPIQHTNCCIPATVCDRGKVDQRFGFKISKYEPLTLK